MSHETGEIPFAGLGASFATISRKTNEVFLHQQGARVNGEVPCHGPMEKQRRWRTRGRLTTCAVCFDDPCEPREPRPSDDGEYRGQELLLLV